MNQSRETGNANRLLEGRYRVAEFIGDYPLAKQPTWNLRFGNLGAALLMAKALFLENVGSKGRVRTSGPRLWSKEYYVVICNAGTEAEIMELFVRAK